MKTFVRRAANLVLGCVLALAAPACAAMVTPDAELMAGWATKSVDLKGPRLEFEYPPEWAVESELVDDKIPAAEARIHVPRDFGPFILLTVLRTPPSFPKEGTAHDAAVIELLDATKQGVVKGRPSGISEIMETPSLHGGTYKVLSLNDETLPEQPTSPKKYKYATVGAMEHGGFIISFAVLHHEPAPPENEQLLGVIRTAHVVAGP